ncbi:MAG: transporter substrate-binding domain-containing protein [Desulfobacteraceae bacterium]|nr:transporter substrate-binding domain-containing protein [Desulfobacteraceae bacterium]
MGRGSISVISFCVVLFTSMVAGTAVCSDELVCGIATGFPPYQFRARGEVTGFDADVARLVLSRLEEGATFYQDSWDDVVGRLRYGNIDLITGMEISGERKRFFDFSTVYYHRYTVIFVRADNSSIESVEDLYKKIITGDRHSFIESHWEKLGIKGRIRIRQMKSKERAMELLFQGKSHAAIMPKAVGLYLAEKMGFKVRILNGFDPGTPVAMAVKKGNYHLLERIDRVLKDLMEKGEIDKLYAWWFKQGSDRGLKVRPPVK